MRERRPAGPNWDLRRIDRSFPYAPLLVRGRPERREEALKHPPMDRGHRARIFAPFDALDGFSDLVRQKDRLFEEAAPEKTEGNICMPWEDP